MTFPLPMKSSTQRMAFPFLLAAVLLSGRLLATDAAESVDIGGRTLRMLVRGSGSPTVVIEAGMGEPPTMSGTWTRVVDALSKSNRVVLYDRAGLGQSDPATRLPRTSADIAADLDALLSKAAIPGPYLLVGHSYGGLHIRMFASRFPGKVAGMVLVDASHPEQERRWLAAFGPEQDGEPETLRQVRRHLASRTMPESNPEKIDPKATAEQIRDARDLGDKPLVILTHSSGFKIDPSLPEGNLRQIEAVWTGIQEGFRHLSSRSTLLQSENGGHNLPGEDPDLVVRGVRSVLGQLGASRKPNP